LTIFLNKHVFYYFVPQPSKMNSVARFSLSACNLKRLDNYSKLSLRTEAVSIRLIETFYIAHQNKPD